MIHYLRLFRLPNVFTAIADVMAGFLLMRGMVDRDNAGILAGLCAASALLYTAGMVLNDVFDMEVDRVERPERPLPSGKIPLLTAQLIGSGMLLGGVLLAWQAPFWGAPMPVQPLAASVVGLLLAAAILAYDAWLKNTVAGPLSMGVCRGLNLLLGMVAVSPLGGNGSWLGVAPLYYLLPLGATLYITGLTWFGRDEAGEVRRRPLVVGVVILSIGLLLIGGFPVLRSEKMQVEFGLWVVLFLLLAASIVRPFLRAIRELSPAAVQAAVKHGILSLITLDAIIVFYGAEHPAWAAAVIALLFPARLLGRWVYST